ncbi:hypothetical protein [Tepidimonas sediminis]|nr:hypothetical protein [Tepidimonas sediminis]
MKSLAVTLEECEQLLDCSRSIMTLVEVVLLSDLDEGSRSAPQLILNAIAGARHLADEAHRRAEGALDRLVHGR